MNIILSSKQDTAISTWYKSTDTYLKLRDGTVTFFIVDGVLASVETLHLIIQLAHKRHRQCPLANLTHIQLVRINHHYNVVVNRLTTYRKEQFTEKHRIIKCMILQKNPK